MSGVPSRYVYKPGDRKHQHTWRDCAHCGERYLGRVDSNSRFCSRRCAGKATGRQPRPAASREGYLVCVKCGEEKPEEAFARQAQSVTGRRPRCRACTAEYWVATRSPEILARMRENDRRRWRENPEELRARAAVSTTRYREANRELIRERARLRYLENPEPRKNTEARRRAQKRGSAVIDFTPDLLTAKWTYWSGRCWICGSDAAEWDHVKPLSKGGAHILANLRPACAPCNRRKWDRWPYRP